MTENWSRELVRIAEATEVPFDKWTEARDV